MAAAHRARFLSAMEDGVAVFPTGPERVRSRDTHYKFRPDSDFWYLTAFAEPDAVAVFAPHHDDGPFVLFVRPRDPEMETWNGRRAGVEGATAIYGADTAYPIEKLDELLPKLLKGADRLYYATGRDPDLDRRVHAWTAALNAKSRDGVLGPRTVVDPATILHEARLFKTPEELELLRKAAAITDEAHRAAIEAVAPGVIEYEVEAVVDGTFRRRGGWGPGYTTIAASGDNANILHYVNNDQPARDGDMFLLDAGCEYMGYTADVTRTFPVSGRYSPAQRELYEVVLASQVAAVEHVRPGVTFQSVHEVALRKLVEGMIGLELLRGTVDENIESGTFRKYYMHKTSHWLGIDVHDVGCYHVDGEGENGKVSRALEPGMVLTVEPGLYVTAADDQAPERLRGIGIRIEDDVLVTADGHENLTAAIPKTVADVEACW
ncbi:MAG: aminopeptidase P N-terminal domain-containing protein [Planctomycetes bacterium]|nr:aminopeptidase P N-terminal domain-containing protein [Planctomycetota bacterium]